MLKQKYQNHLRECRAKQGLKQVELASRSGVSLPTISRLECWHLPTTPATAKKLAAALGTNPQELFPYLEKLWGLS
jgi:transcriptional regulator with XRE-family HTH domain